MVRREVRLERLIVGLHGLALLRGWPLGDPDEADARLASLAGMLAVRDTSPGEIFEVDELDHDAAYVAWAETYDILANPLLDLEEVALRDLLEGLPPGDAVDVACGTGRVASLLADAGHRVTGVDASSAMLAIAIEKVPSGVFVLGTFERLPIDDGASDLAVSTLALTHAADLEAPIREIARIVRPGGAIVLSDVHPVAVMTGGQAMFRRADGSRAVTLNHQHWVSDYLRAFASTGLVVERCEEPLADEGFFEAVLDPTVRRADSDALVGVPAALLWRLRRA
jgi:ubiquinone/menaquinone biosynthesis C-methylase UbiE